MTIANVLELSTTDASNVDFKGVGIQGSSSLANGDDAMRALGAMIASAVTRRVAKSADATAAKTDHNQLWDFSVAATLSLTAAATLTTGWALWVRASGGVVTIDPNGAETIDGAATLSVPNGSTILILCNGTAFYTLMGGAPVTQLVQPKIAQGRLTLTAGTAITTSDVTGATTIYYTPYKGNVVWLYTSSLWSPYTFTEKSLALGTLSSGVNYDVFLYDNSGTLTLEAVAWSSDTGRATALTTQDGVYVKSGSTNKRYVGTFRTTSTTTTEDSRAKRFVWNMDNRAPRPMRVIDTTDNWSNASGTMRQANANTANQLDMVRGLDEDAVTATVKAAGTATGTTGQNLIVAVGLDSTTTMDANCIAGRGMNYVAGSHVHVSAFYSGFPGVGRHYLVWLEANSVVAFTWVGDSGSNTLGQSGIAGLVMA